MAVSLEGGGWRAELDALLARFGRLFVRAEPREQAGRYLEGLLGPVERKNGWQLAEHLGDARPWRTQRVLSHVLWDEEAARDLCRDHAVERLGAGDAVLVVDETGFVKKGEHSAGVARQYCGAVGKVENCRVGVFLAYGSRRGHALIDRRLYLPEAWAGDAERRRAAKVPEGIPFLTKPEIAREMLARALDAGVPCAWVLGDEVYGADRRLRAMLEERGRPHVLAIRSNDRLDADLGGGGGAGPALRAGDPQQRPGGRGPGRGGRTGHAGGADARPAAGGVAAAERRRGHQGRAPVRLGAAAAGPAAGCGRRRPAPGALAAGPALGRGPRGPGLLRRVRPGGVAAARPRPGRGAALAGRGVLRGRQAGGGPGGLRGAELARLAPARHPRHAGARPPGRPAGRAERGQRGRRAARELLVPLSVPELRRLIVRLAPGRDPPTAGFVLAWSFWRRAHQAVAQACHWGRRLMLTQPQL